jgi:hypothetical protein
MARKSKKRFIQKAIKRPGALSRQLGIPIEKDIPITLLRKIRKAKAGEIITNPTKLGKKRIKVTRLLERRAIFAIFLKRIRKKKKSSKYRRK